MKPEDVKVFIMPKNRSMEHYNVINYAYPDNQKFLLLMIDENYSELFELNKYSKESGSFFVDNYVKSDGSVYFATKVDPLFLLLPYLDRISKMSLPAQTPFNFDDILAEPQMKDVHDIVKYAINKRTSLSLICDLSTDESRFLFSEKKTIKFLKAKYEKILNHMKTKVADIDNCKWYAFELVATYLTENVKKKLMDECGIKLIQSVQKRKANPNNRNFNENKVVKKAKTSSVSSSASKFQQAAKGCKPITAFFKKA